MLRFRLQIVLIVLAVVPLTNVLGQDQLSPLQAKRAAFKEKMLPKVGQVVTVPGPLSVGKLAEFIATEDGGAVYMKSRDIDKINELARLILKRLTVTGTLQFAKEVPPPEPGIAAIEEHFFMVIEKATIRTGIER